MTYIISSADTSINWDATEAERIAQNVLNIIRTRKREIPFMPGLGMQADNIDSLAISIKQDIQEEVTALLNKYESRAEVLSVSITSVTEDGNVEITVELEV